MNISNIFQLLLWYKNNNALMLYVLQVDGILGGGCGHGLLDKIPNRLKLEFCNTIGNICGRNTLELM
eukprot:5445393-Ditylum_brightwellii.AAC.1